MVMPCCKQRSAEFCCITVQGEALTDRDNTMNTTTQDAVLEQAAAGAEAAAAAHCSLQVEGSTHVAISMVMAKGYMDSRSSPSRSS